MQSSFPMLPTSNRFTELAKKDQWDEIVNEGLPKLENALKNRHLYESAILSVQLTTAFFSQKKYADAIDYSELSLDLSSHFENPAFKIRAFFLQAVIYRSLAEKSLDNDHQLFLYSKAIEIAENALHIFTENDIANQGLKAKILSNLGRLYVEQPNPDFSKAIHYYSLAISSFVKAEKMIAATRVKIRLAKVYLAQKNYASAKDILNQIAIKPLNFERPPTLNHLSIQFLNALNEIEISLQSIQNKTGREPFSELLQAIAERQKTLTK
ncbi:putative uncharacterized protein [Parachlamydia acanthamoebae UV-7]|uniref:MalT-like TPR region domain-containing protein n=2 Tax=Parachlamydia acanthamoebae TaxID=83552 RepID=F8KZS5_PARAV|nr:hypothetical protein [Parachlamydia acanthamoebae]KIA77835.1 hypothetical protein DB43_FN00040 [Parachlamydia acanthamoebae]CCB86432.1 putative uncharacterized protein [Parachlamydia acanthamoebae UV-7]